MAIPTNVILSTRYNFLKIYENENDTFSVPTGRNDVLLTTHSLGYIPRVKAWFVPVSGQVWPLVRYQYSNSDGGPGTTLDVFGGLRITSSAVYADMSNSSGSPQDVTFYWRVYLDE
jgi:hypothetical protein